MKNKEHKFLPICFSLDFRRNYQTAISKTIIISEHTGRPVITELVTPKTKILLFQTSPPLQTRQMQKAKLGRGPTPIQTQLVRQFAQDPCREQSTCTSEAHPPTLRKMGCLFSILQSMFPVYEAKQLNKVVHAPDSSTEGLRLEDQELQVSVDYFKTKEQERSKKLKLYHLI